MKVTKQSLHTEKNGTVVLRNKIDCSDEVNKVREYNETTNGYFGDKNGRCMFMGCIPPAFWNFDPWLITARRAQKEGDMRTYLRNLKKFFDLHQAFKVNHKRIYWRGTGAFLL
ncbi:hypothetical protein NXG27_00910 [Megasphaera paucivorans]|uniref:Uncharacterized protein n=1 Tax=Megasphaera paucivorans TaxID=349095 RepID=A0A1G9QC03_9FIRM|nr:hypothetical protein [Megasphaera paucivorans]SDM08546.1 hypothetical protein SAMN05660299_00184 [Megasphaera paucivorans]